VSSSSRHNLNPCGLWSAGEEMRARLFALTRENIGDGSSDLRIRSREGRPTCRGGDGGEGRRLRSPTEFLLHVALTVK